MNWTFHNHHIKPKHVGGTDNPSNLCKVNKKLHALLHKILYNEYGNLFDLYAFQLLNGEIPAEEARKKSCAEGIRTSSKAKKASSKTIKKYNASEKHKKSSKLGAMSTHKKKDVKGKSIHAKKLGSKVGKENRRLGRGICGLTIEEREIFSSLGGKTAHKENPDLAKKAGFKGLITRWGIKVNGRRIPKEFIPTDFLEYCLEYQIRDFSLEDFLRIEALIFHKSLL